LNTISITESILSTEETLELAEQNLSYQRVLIKLVNWRLEGSSSVDHEFVKYWLHVRDAAERVYLKHKRAVNSEAE
jgi:hypothetical protein